MKTAENIVLDTEDDDDIEEEPVVAQKETIRQVHHLPGISLETKQPPSKPDKRLSLGEILEKMVVNREKVEKPAKTLDINKVETEDAELLETPAVLIDGELPEPPEIPLLPKTDETEVLSVEEENLAVNIGSEGPPQPPEPPEILPPNGDKREPDPDPEPHRIPPATARLIPPISSPTYSMHNAAAVDRQTRTNHEQELNDTAYYAEKRGVRRGLGAGLLFGWMFGRHGKKKQAKEFNKQLKTKDKQISSLMTEQIAASGRIDSIRRTQEQIRPSIQVEGVKRPAGPESTPKTANKLPEIAYAKPKIVEKLYTLKEVPKSALTEKARKIADIATIASVVEAANIFEKSRVVSRTIMEQVDSTISIKEKLAAVIKTELPPEDRQITEETYQEPEGSKVEASAWHRIELDKKTGKPVKDPEVAYGEAFRQEQRQEVWREDKRRARIKPAIKPDVKTGGGAMAGQLGGLATSSYGSSSSSGAYQTVSPPANSSVNQPIKTTALESKQFGNKTGSELLRHASSPVIWITAIIIVVTLFILGVLR